jgi:hypothetical protein
MLKRIIFSSLFCICFFTSNTIKAQEKSNKNSISYYLEDNASERTNILWVRPTSIVNGGLPICYEKAFGKKFSLYAGAGPIIPALYYNLWGFEPDLSYNTFNGGYTLWFSPKFFLRNKAPYGSFCSFPFRWNSFKYDNIRYNVKNIGMLVGKTFHINANFVAEYSFGWNIGKKPDSPNPSSVTLFSDELFTNLVAHLGIGYQF